MGQRPRKWTPNDPPNCPLIDLSPFPGSLTHSGQYFDFPWPPLPTRSSFGVQNGLYMGPTYSITCFTVLYAYSLYPGWGKLLFPQHLPGSSNGVWSHAISKSTISLEKQVLRASSRNTTSSPCGRCRARPRWRRRSWSTQCQRWWQSLVEPMDFSLDFLSSLFGITSVP